MSGKGGYVEGSGRRSCTTVMVMLVTKETTIKKAPATASFMRSMTNVLENKRGELPASGKGGGESLSFSFSGRNGGLGDPRLLARPRLLSLDPYKSLLPEERTMVSSDLKEGEEGGDCRRVALLRVVQRDPIFFMSPRAGSDMGGLRRSFSVSSSKASPSMRCSLNVGAK
mmetsp:Transcript_1499/g.2971  ORF Transcript_1499/g.2971 Transcript_1499/m.2971 type:complete len:170 (-) Transcript_1499:284-793(-)